MILKIYCHRIFRTTYGILCLIVQRRKWSLMSCCNQILSDIVQDWENLHDEDRRVLSRLNNFFWGLHSLVHIAQTADKALTETENKYFDGNVPILNKQFSKKQEIQSLFALHVRHFLTMVMRTVGVMDLLLLLLRKF